MATDKVRTLNARKQPRQSRSQLTVDAIFEATVQVLLAEGLQRLTTVRVAARAGVSVGTLYQYYPHKQALLYGVLQRHLGRIAQSVEMAAADAHHTSLPTMVEKVVSAYVNAKTERIDDARAMYAVAGELGGRELVRDSEMRCRAAFVAMLETEPDVQFDDPPLVSVMLSASLIGPTRLLIEGETPVAPIFDIKQQLLALCLGYLERVARPRLHRE